MRGGRRDRSDGSLSLYGAELPGLLRLRDCCRLGVGRAGKPRESARNDSDSEGESTSLRAALLQIPGSPCMIGAAGLCGHTYPAS